MILRVRAICLPSSDVGFANVVARCLDEGTASPAALEDVLRPLYPAAVVRARELSGEVGETWYVYRDGRFVPPGGVPWWGSDDVPRVVLEVPSGLIVQANAAIAEILGTTPGEMLGRPYLGFVTEDAAAAAAVLFETCLLTGFIETVARVRRPDGETMVFEIRATLQPEGIEILYRPVALTGESREGT